MRKVEAKVSWGNQRSRLLHVFAESLAQSGVQKVRSGVIPFRRFTNISMHNRFELLSKMDRLACLHCVRTDPLDRHHATVYICDHVAGTVAEEADVAHLPAGIGVEGEIVLD